MAIDRAQIRHVAELAELTLTDDEEARLTAEIGKIVAYVEELSSVDTTGVPPTAHVSAGIEVALRPDEPKDGLSHEEALAGAPKVAHEGFSVPTFVE
jgi:aspartyl-tRNA(Asn)/glutamyl-tRNA(Gln) amidotransferase subunit C